MRNHEPVLLQEVIKYLDPKPQEKFIDATVGLGGHTFKILAQGAKVLGIDRDPQAIEHIKKEVQGSRIKVQNLILVQGNFANIGQIAKNKSFFKVSGILFDLGVSTPQLEKAKRGFSFLKDGPLDMRMDPGLEITAEDIVNNFDKRRLNEILYKYGQEKLSRSIVDVICRTREVEKIKTTGQLAKICEEVYRKRFIKSKLHSATKTFQGLRIVVNSELINLEEALPQTVELLENKGRLVVISFHSLEDGIVKRFFKEERNLRILTKKPIGPQKDEIIKNPRARSAKLRVAEKILV